MYRFLNQNRVRPKPRARKLLLIMKLTTLLLITGILQVSAGALAQKVTLSEVNAPLIRVMNTIREQTGYDFAFTKSQLETARPVSIQVANMELADALRHIFSGQDLDFTIEDKSVVISRKIKLPDAFLPFSDFKGKVTDQQGNPLAGASVRIKGSAKGTVTDQHGAFSMNVEKGQTIVVSYTGYAEKEIMIGEEGSLHITLQPKESELNAVTVSGGYYTTTQRNKTGSISKVTSKDIEKQPVTSPLLALQGRMPGVEITPTSGAPGSAVKIRIRGQNSIRDRRLDNIDGNLPLYVIDGIPIMSSPVASASESLLRDGLDPINTLNPANIESIEVLKDADATAIYGSRGANGVILITTKQKREEGRFSVDAGISRGIGEIVRRVELLSSEQYLAMRHEAIQNDGGAALDEYNDPNPTFRAYYYPDLLAWDTTRYTDWQDLLLGSGSDITDAQMSFSGGNRQTSFGLGGSYHHETLLYGKEFGLKRYTLNFNFHHRSANDRLELSLTGNYGISEHQIFNHQNMMANALNVPPVGPNPLNDDGSLNWAPILGVSTYLNPLTFIKSPHHSSAHSLMTNAVMSYRFGRYLKAMVSAGISDYTQDEMMQTTISSQRPSTQIPPKGRSEIRSNRRTGWIVEPQLVYQREEGAHFFEGVAGMTIQQQNENGLSTTGNGYTSDALLSSIGSASVVTSNNSSSQYRYGSVFARLGYRFKERYILNLTGRRDGSSRFGPDNRYGNFGAVGAGWIFSSEPFLQAASPILSFGKIRASYGTTGNDQIGDSKFLKTYEAGYSTYDGEVALVPTGIYNPDYAWEVTRKLEVALEAGFFKDRLNIELAHYRNRSSNQLTPYTLPMTTGFTDVLRNFEATIENKGWELSISSRNISKGNFRWTSTFNYSRSRNMLVAYPGIEESPYAYSYKVGMPLSVQLSYHWLGVDPQTGLHMVEDVNGNGRYDLYGDRVFTKALEPLFFGGLSNTFRYKDFELNLFVQYTDKLANVSYFNAPGTRVNQPISVLNRWRKPGDITDVQRFTTRGESTQTYSRWRQSDGAIQKVSFLRLKTATLSYSLPATALRKIGLQSAQIYAQGQNLITFSKFDGWDPETIWGVPPLRIIQLGLQLKL